MQTTLRVNHLTVAAALLLGSCLPALAAEAPRAEMPIITEFKPGQYNEYTVSDAAMGGCTRWRNKEITKDGLLVSECKDLLLYRSVANSLNLVKMTKTNGDVLWSYEPYMPTMAFPLEVGKVWTGEYAGYTEDTGDKWKAKTRCEAVAYEKVSTVAGEFDAFRIDCVHNWRAMVVFSGEKRSSTWYAPKIASVVKFVHEDTKYNHLLTGYNRD